MAYRQDQYEALAGALGAMPGLSEKKMFGGICFLLNGNMIAAVVGEGVMVRVGKERLDAALALDGVGPFNFSGRKMGGYVEATEDAIADEGRLAAVLDLAIAFVGPMPPK